MRKTAQQALRVPPEADAPAPVISNRFLIPFAGMLLALNAFANDSLLPAFFGIAADLNAPIQQVQTLIPVFVIAAGFGQLISGPLSDRFGRRPLIFAGLGLFFTGTVLCAAAQSILLLQLGRIVQGAGSACLVVMGRASLRDTQSGPALARAMALTSGIFAVGPMLAPVCGVVLMLLWGWRAVFAGSLAVVIALTIATVWGYRETNTALNPHALDPARLRAAVLRIWRNHQSRTFLLIAAILQYGSLSMVSNSPRLFKSQFGIEGVAFAFALAGTAVGIAIGQALNHRLLGRLGVFETTRLAAALVLAAVATIVVATALKLQSAPLFLVQLTVFNIGFLAVLSNAASLVLEPHREIAGLCASLYGFVTLLTGSLLALATFGLFAGRMLPWSLGMLLTVAIVYAAIVSYQPEMTDNALE